MLISFDCVYTSAKAAGRLLFVGHIGFVVKTDQFTPKGIFHF